LFGLESKFALLLVHTEDCKVLLDNKSINVAYDFVREKRKRAKFNKQEDRAATGKEIVSTVNNVLMFVLLESIFEMVQLECVNCTACIDECDTIMESVGLPKRPNSLCLRRRNREKTHFKFTARMKGIQLSFFILVGILTGLLFYEQR
jgi:polyferredoxin